MCDKLYEDSKRVKGYGFEKFWEGFFKEKLIQNENYTLDSARIEEAEKLFPKRADGISVQLKVIQRLPDFQNFIDTLDSDFEHPLFYRGQTNANYLLNPSALRDDPAREHKLIREFQRKFYNETGKCRTTMDKLVLMQHYLLQTRCLDISENPLIALYFACQDMKKYPNTNNPDANKYCWGEVTIFQESGGKKDMKYDDSSTTSIIANIAFLEEKFSLDKLGMLYQNDYHVAYNANYIRFRDILRRSVIVRSPQINERIRHQQGAFILVNANEIDDTEKWKFNTSIEEFTDHILGNGKGWWHSLDELGDWKKEFANAKASDFHFRKIRPLGVSGFYLNRQ
ncbi:MAG: FRG domain-containing protein [Spirochaetia bacterium]|nr:FRG domain-containing protein [Spirochaetia bacterium]